MNPLKTLVVLLLLVVISACDKESLEISETEKKPKEKIQSTETSDSSDGDGCETAFAKFHDVCVYDGYVFTNRPNNNPDGYRILDISNRWGWATNINVSWGKETFELWAGAAKNDVSKGTLVGEVTVMRKKSTGEIRVSYEIYEGFVMTELHIYANDLAPTTAAPGQFTFTKEFMTPTDSYGRSFTVHDSDDDGVWVIAHAVVCPI